MKLLTKTSLIYLFTTLLVFVIGGIIFYSNLRKIVDDETTERLYTEKSQIEEFVKANDTVPQKSFTSGDFFEFKIIAEPIHELIRDTILYSKEEGEDLPFRQLIFPLTAKGKNYEGLVSKNLFESDDLVEAISLSFISLIIVLLVVTLITNRIVAKVLWKPFFKTIGLLGNYKIDKHESLTFSNTSTSEFNSLNESLEKMTEKIHTDYKNLKAFTENASHELQTPLSVILASTEQLLQEKNMEEKQLNEIQRINQTARKLSKLNQTLLLLAKIENGQFAEKEIINIDEVIDSKLALYSELINHKEITLRKHIAKGVQLNIHPVLAEILISNLLTNAIRHNVNNGKIEVELTKNKLTVCNSGQIPISNPQKLFDRFYKENISIDSTGLGLSLVKQIIETNEMTINYHYSGNLHCFELSF